MIISDYLPTFNHVVTFLAGSTAMGILGNAVNSFPTPDNKYGQWFLGVIKYAVGQRISALNAIQGMDTAVAAIPRGTGTGTGQSSKNVSSHVEVTPEKITNITETVAKTEVSIPNPNPDKGAGGS